MPVLVEVHPSKVVKFRDTSGVVWRTYGVVEDTTGGSDVLYVSIDGQALDHFWDAFIESFTSPQYQMAQDYGGFIRLGFGQIVFSIELFANDWPPPKQCVVTIRHTDTTEDASKTVFAGDIYMNEYDVESVSYEINAPKFPQRLLDIGTDYATNTVPYPKAFGVVTHVEPLRLVDDDASRPCYHLGGISTTSVGFKIISYSSADGGAATTVTTDAAHGYSNTDTVIIAGSINFNGSHTISDKTATTFRIPIPFPTDNSETVPIHAVAYQSGDFIVFDDGVPIQGNVVLYPAADTVEGAFSLSASPVGKVTMSGTGAQTTLLEIITWAQARFVIGSLFSDHRRALSPDVYYWAETQMPLIDFLSDVCAFFTHYFFIEYDGLTLGDMLLDNGTLTLTEDEYFTSSYGAMNAVSQLKAAWVTHEAATGQVNEVDKTKYIKDIKNTIIEAQFTVVTGTTDSTAAKYLKDSTATFVTKKVEIGDVVWNTTDDTYTTAVEISEEIIQLEHDIFVSGEAYIIGPAFPYGADIDITPYHDNKTVVAAALQNILSVLVKDYAEVSIPISNPLPVPGERITFPDTELIVDTSTYIRARNLTYDFNNDEVIVSGEGIIT